MKTFSASKKEWQPPHKLATADQASGDNDELLATLNGEPAVAQLLSWGQDEQTLADLNRLLRFGIKFQRFLPGQKGLQRLSGIRSTNEYFGTTPPDPVRKRYACRDARVYEKHPELRVLMNQISVAAWKSFQEHLPKQAAEHERIVREAIHPDWFIGGTPFTSGIINDRSALPYHKDAGNLKGTWSMMLSLRANTDGGGLDIPELGITLGIPDRSMTIFEGQKFWHGVTPLVYRKKDAYRFTLVWYVKQACRLCGCRADEPERASKETTKIQDGYTE